MNLQTAYDNANAPTRYACGMTTRSARACRRGATVHYVHANGQCVAHYCAQHANGHGVARMLLPRAYEYDHVERYALGKER